MERNHKTIQTLLPWFVNGSLVGRERERVLVHLQGCAACRAERDELQRLQALVANAPGPEAGQRDHALSYARVSRRMDAFEVDREAIANAQRARFAWRTGIAAVFLVGLGFMMQTSSNRSGDTLDLVLAESASATAASLPDAFETMTPAGPALNAYRIAVTMTPGLAPGRLRAFLIEHRADLVTGPDASGTFVLDIPVDAGVELSHVLGAVTASPLVTAASPAVDAQL